MEEINPRYKHLVQVMGIDVFHKIQKAKVLMVGAGNQKKKFFHSYF